MSLLAQAPIKFELVLDLKTAKAFGLSTTDVFFPGANGAIE